MERKSKSLGGDENVIKELCNMVCFTHFPDFSKIYCFLHAWWLNHFKESFFNFDKFMSMLLAFASFNEGIFNMPNLWRGGKE
jgi:hypothetical protein